MIVSLKTLQDLLRLLNYCLFKLCMSGFSLWVYSNRFHGGID